MAKEELFSFIPEAQLTSSSSDPEFRVSLNSTRMLYFPREIVEIYDLDKKWFKFYADIQKKAIAWKYFSEGDIGELSGLRRLTINPTNKSGIISVQKLLSAIGIKELKGVIPDIPVKRYRGPGYLTEEVNYIVVHEKDAKERRKYRTRDDSAGLPGDESIDPEVGYDSAYPTEGSSDNGRLLGAEETQDPSGYRQP